MSADTQTIIFLIVIVAIVGGLAGGLIAGLAVGMIRRSQTVEVRAVADGTLNVPVQLQADPVALRIHTQVAQPDPVLIEVATGGAPSQRELAARVLSVFETIGPTDLAAIVGCAKSTASAIIRDAQSGRLSLQVSGENDAADQ